MPRAHGKLLLVDGAHGAHFPAVGLPTPVAEGADMAVLSMHKTLPCMGQGAVLLSAAGVDRRALREKHHAVRHIQSVLSHYGIH